MTLYEIDAALLACIDPETGEIDEEQWEALTIDREVKIENTALLIKELIAEADLIKREEKALEDRRKKKENTVRRLKENINRSLAGQKFETARVAISFRKSESLEIGFDALIPEEYLKPVEPKVDVMALKAAVKSGESFFGVTLVEKQNVNIK